MRARWNSANTLAPLKNVKNKVSVLTGLAQHNAFALGRWRRRPCSQRRNLADRLSPAQNGWRRHQGRHFCRPIGGDARWQENAFRVVGIGLRARRDGRELRLRLQLRLLIFHLMARAESTPNAHEVDPRAVFERLFGNSDPNETQESRMRRQGMKRSILDFVLEDANKLKRQLGR